ncbi:hypothetical protein WN48_05905 [Eufriesea mexicana]|uniref:Uncharacterized protein n=1 Tax=Eufriesea mexicana TaxID=516756 RepID=A0A310SC80_9HYME|nr:hypothetical protein WN48_05905 [Eufriesea mexicana]
MTHLVLRGSRCGILVPKKSCSFSATFEHDSTETETRLTTDATLQCDCRCCASLFPFLALLDSDVTCENAPPESRLARDRTVFSKAPHDYYWPEYATSTTDWSMGMRTASCAVYGGSNRLRTVYRHLTSRLGISITNMQCFPDLQGYQTYCKVGNSEICLQTKIPKVLRALTDVTRIPGDVTTTQRCCRRSAYGCKIV